MCNIEVFKQHNFATGVIRDMDNSLAHIQMESGYMTVDGLERLAAAIEGASERNVITCFFTDKPEMWDKRDDPEFDAILGARYDKLDAAIKFGHNLGAHVNLRPANHLKLIVIDYAITWGGSLNPLSYTGLRDEEAWRFTDPQWAQDCVRRRRYEDCGGCKKLLAEYEETEVRRMEHILGTDRRALGKQIADARKAAGLTQEQLANLVGVSKHQITRIESGLAVPDAEQTINIFTVFSHKLLLAHDDMAPTLVRWMNLMAARGGLG